MPRKRWHPVQSKRCLSCGTAFERRDHHNFNRMKYCSHACAHQATRKDVAKCFWAKVNKDAPGGCWIWTGSIKPRNGYGHMRSSGKDYNAHRWAYADAHGEIQDGMEVMHTCDVPACVNPAHMRLGTHSENMRDCKTKRRHIFGERQPLAKLTEAQAREILSLKPNRIVHGLAKSIAQRFGVGPGAVTAIWRGSLWKHIQEAA